MLRNWRRISWMLRIVHSRGLKPPLIAAFSAGSPKASKPIGRKTLSPCIRRKRPMASVGVTMYQWPVCRSPEG
jgi:hypothetical protein